MEGDLLVGLLKLILINIVLSGDNAVVIALACRNLPADQQKKAVFWGSCGAILLRILLTFAAVWLLQVPFVQVAGALLLLYIAVSLLKGEDHTEALKASSKIGEAIRTIIVADLVMSLDNVLAVAGAAGGNLLLIVAGLAISIPLIVWGSQLLMRLMNRFPVIVLLGAALLGYTAGEMALSDKAVGHWIEASFPAGHYMLPIGLAVMVVVVGKLAGRRLEKEHAQKEAENHSVS
ncbi:TerC family protein [Paenibacillus ehimensis]|uniref:TerC family protein n=1 Tax=Paenibacillus ehimensis TaxID=79264 RepID=UPI003D2BAE5F